MAETTSTTAFCPVCTSTVDNVEGELDCVSCEQTFELVSKDTSVTLEEEIADTSVVAFCPVCCSDNDLLCKDGQTVVIECGQCSQKVKFTVEAERFASHAI